MKATRNMKNATDAWKKLIKIHAAQKDYAKKFLYINLNRRGLRPVLSW